MCVSAAWAAPQDHWPFIDPIPGISESGGDLKYLERDFPGNKAYAGDHPLSSLADNKLQYVS